MHILAAGLVACLAAPSVFQTAFAHPNAACPSVSSHTQIAATSNAVNYTDPQVAGTGKNVVAIFQTDSDNQLLGAYGSPWDTFFSDSGGYWDMDCTYINGTFQVAPSIVRSSARIASYNNVFIVVYSASATLVTSKVVSATFNGVSAKVDISNSLTPEYAVLVAGASGFFYFAVQGTTLIGYSTSDGASWGIVDVSVLSAPFSASLAAAVDPKGNVVVVYHTSNTGLAAGVSLGGTSQFTQVAAPSLVGGSVGVASRKESNFMMVVNDANVIKSSYSSNLGATWSSEQIVQSTGVQDMSPVFVVGTSERWVPLWLGSGGAQYRTTTADLPITANWTAAPVNSFVTGTTTKFYSAPAFVSTGGRGWAFVAVDNSTFDVSSRACFEIPVSLAPTPSRSPTSSANAVPADFALSVLMVVSTFVALMN